MKRSCEERKEGNGCLSITVIPGRKMGMLVIIEIAPEADVLRVILSGVPPEHKSAHISLGSIPLRSVRAM